MTRGGGGGEGGERIISVGQVRRAGRGGEMASVESPLELRIILTFTKKYSKYRVSILYDCVRALKGEYIYIY